MLLSGCAASDRIDAPEDVLEIQEPVEATDDPVVEETRASTGGAGGFTAGPITRFSKRRAMTHVRKLASDIGVRVRGRRGEYRASRYLAARFRELGYNVHIQKFSVDGRTSRNVVAWWPETRRYDFVVGGHMDSVPRSPGANDNASGAAVVVELARIFAGKAQARHVRFVAFGSEEYGSNGLHHVGSQVYVNRLGTEGRSRLAGMVSVDMVADGRPLLVGNSAIASDVVARSLYRRIRDAGIGVRYHTLCDCSDHGPFEHAGIPAAFAYSGPEPNYHDPTDTVRNMKPDDLRRTGRAMRTFVKAIDAGMLRYFRRNR